MANELSDAQVFGAAAPKQLSDAEVFGSGVPNTNEPDPVSNSAFQQSSAGKILDAAQGNALTRPFTAAGIGIKNAFTDGGELGLSKESQQKLADLGVFNDYKNNHIGFMTSMNEAVLKPAAATADLAIRSINAAATGTAALAGGVLDEAKGALGLGQADPSTIASQAQDFTDYLFITSGMNAEGIASEVGKTAPSLKQVLTVKPDVKAVEAATPELRETAEGVAPPQVAPVGAPVMAEKMDQPVIKAPIENPMIDEKSGNLNLNYITTDDDAKSMLARTAQAYADTNGVTVKTEQTIKEGQDFLDKAMEETADGVPEPLANYNRGDPINRPMLYAARQLTVQATSDAIKAVRTAVATGAPADVQAAVDADERLMAMTGVRHEVSAEAGRVLQSHTIPMGEEGANDLEMLAEKMTGMTQDDRIRLMATFDSPEAIAKFVRDVKKPTWGEMGIFYIINNYLSGPITHLAYTASWAVQTVIRAGIETPVASAVGRIQKAMGKTLEPEEVKALQDEREMLAAKLRDADAGIAKMKASDGVKSALRIKDITQQLNRSVTVMPGEAAARFYGIGQGAWDSICAAGRALKTGNIQMLPNELASAKQAAKEAVDKALEEGKSAEEAQKRGEAAYNKSAVYAANPIIERASFIKNPQAKALTEAAGITIGVPTRVIAGIHSLQKYSGYAESMNAFAYRQAVSEGLTSAEDIGARIAQIKSNATPEMIKKAVDEAKYAALMGKPGEFGQAIENLAHVNGWTRMVVPFSRVVTNLASQKFLERTPLGWLSGNIREDLLGKNGNAAQANAIGKMATGTTLLSAGAWLRAQGISNGQAPDDPNQRARAFMEGKPPYTVRIGDWNVPHRFFGVPAGSLSIGADMHDIFQNAKVNEEDGWAIIGNSIHVLGNDMLQENALKGAADLYDAIRNKDQEAAKSYVINALTSAATPYSVGLGQTTRAIDPVMRSTMGDTFWERFVKSEKSHIPWESTDLTPRVDIFGRPMQRGGDYEKMLQDPVMQALVKLDIYPAKVSPRILNVKLNDEQYYDYATKAGAMFYAGADKLVNDPNWPRYDAETQFDMLQNMQKEARAAARQYMCIAHPGISESCAKYSKKLVQKDE